MTEARSRWASPWAPALVATGVLLLANAGVVAWFELRLLPRIDAIGAVSNTTQAAPAGRSAGGKPMPSTEQQATFEELAAQLDEETIADIRAEITARGLPPFMGEDPEGLLRNLFYSGHLLPEPVLLKELQRLAPDLLEGNEDRYVRNSILLNLIASPESRSQDPKQGQLAAGVTGLVGAKLPEGDTRELGESYCVELVANLNERLEGLAEDKGLDPTTVLPSQERRRAATEPCEVDSAAMRQLLEDYRQAFYTLESDQQSP